MDGRWGAECSLSAALGAQRIVIATLCYHWAGVRWRGTGEPSPAPKKAPWLAGLAVIAQSGGVRATRARAPERGRRNAR